MTFFGGKALCDYAQTRDNNLNLLRFLAAGAVIVSHSYPLALGREAVEPLEEILGFSLGHVAVCLFFIISGFLVSQSYCRRDDIIDYFAARALRIVPALFVVVTVTAIILGPVFSNVPLKDYFSQPAVGTYVVRNVTLAKLQYSIPTVFERNIYGSSINGSLWTLPYEVMCYVLLGAFAFLKVFERKFVMLAMCASLIVLWQGAKNYSTHTGLWFILDQLIPLYYCFGIGIAAFHFRDRIPINAGILTIAAAATSAFWGTPVFKGIFMLFLAYGTFYLGYVPGGVIRKFNNLGDYSYGIYIIAFPVQQMLVSTFPTLQPVALMSLAFVGTLPLAVASWHYIEKPALAKKAQFGLWRKARAEKRQRMVNG